MSINSLRDEVFAYAKKKYGTSPEYLWASSPDAAVLRHSDNNKWYGLIMRITYDKIDPHKTGAVDVLNVKLADMLLLDLLLKQEGIYYGYHIKRGKWLSVVLDGTVKPEAVFHMLDLSFEATASKQKKEQTRPPREWLIPSNPKYYDILHAFDDADTIDWKQGAGIRVNDTVFIYVGAPVSAVLYKCRVTETDIPCDFHSGSLTIKKLMKIRLLKRYEHEQFTFGRLGSEFGIFAVRGPRGVPNSLSFALNK